MVGMEAELGIADSLHLVKLGVADGSGFCADLFHGIVLEEVDRKKICGPSATSASARPAGRPDLRCSNLHISVEGVWMEAELGIADSLHLVKLGVADGSGWDADKPIKNGGDGHPLQG